MAGEGRWANPTLIGDRILLRPIAVGDAEAMLEMVQDPESRDLTATTTAFTRDQIRAWCESRSSQDLRLDLAIEDIASEEWVGEVVLNEYDEEQASMNFRISLRGPAWFGRGSGTEAGKLILTHAFTSMSLSAVTLTVLARNPRAIRSYQRLGFRETHRFSEGDEEWIAMAVTPADFARVG